MLEKIRQIFMPTDSISVGQYFNLRRKRISFTFSIIIALAAGILTPVCFFIMKAPSSGLGTLFISLTGVLCVFIILFGNDRIGSAIMLSSVALIFMGILASPALQQDAHFPAVLVSIVGLSMILIIPAGIIVSGIFALALGLFFALGVTVLCYMSASEMLLSRIPIVIAIYVISSAVVMYVTRMQDQLLKMAVLEWQNSTDSLKENARIIENIGDLRVKANESQNSISHCFEEVSEVIEAFRVRNEALYQAAGSLEEGALASQKNLGNLLESVETIAQSVSKQKELTLAHSQSQESLVKTIESIRSDVQQEDAATQNLNQLARNSRETLEKTIAEVKGLAEYHAKTLEIVGTLSKISAQTNLLAMNAAIEAAHAGDAGAGFAVVAESVRDLADSSSVRTKEISGIIRSMNDQMVKSAELIETAAASLFSMMEEADKTYELSANISRNMDLFVQETRNMQDGINELTELALTIMEKTESEREVSDSFASTFTSLQESLKVITESIQELNRYNEQSTSIICKASTAKDESANINTAITSLLMNAKR